MSVVTPPCEHRFYALTGGIRCKWCGLQVASNDNAPWNEGAPTMSGWYQVKWEPGSRWDLFPKQSVAILVTVLTGGGAVWSYGEGDDPEVFPGSDTPNARWRFVCSPEDVREQTAQQMGGDEHGNPAVASALQTPTPGVSLIHEEHTEDHQG